MMLDEDDNFSKEKKREYLGDINTSGIHLLNLINDILDISKIAAGRLELSEAEMNLGDVIDDAHTILWPGFSKKKQQCNIIVPHELPSMLADQKLVKQILINLMSNACKYTKEQGKVDVTVWIGKSDELHLQVQDNGIGMTEEQLKSALKPFYQVQSTYVKAESGTGLGLAIVVELAELHGAKLDVHSEPDIGTTVTVTFPPERTIRVDKPKRQIATK